MRGQGDVLPCDVLPWMGEQVLISPPSALLPQRASVDCKRPALRGFTIFRCLPLEHLGEVHRPNTRMLSGRSEPLKMKMPCLQLH